MLPHLCRALLGIMPSAILTVIPAHTPQRHAPLPRAQPRTPTTGLDLGAEPEGLRPPGNHLAPHVSRDAGTRASRRSGASERLTCTLHEMSADADAQPV